MVFWAESPDAGPPDANPAGAASTPASTPTAAARVDAVRISPASFFDNPEYSSSTSLFRAPSFRIDQTDSCDITGRAPALVHPAGGTDRRRMLSAGPWPAIDHAHDRAGGPGR